MGPCEEMDELYDRIEGDAHLDHMRRPGINLVRGFAPADHVRQKVMVIGEYPSAVDNGRGTPFNGRPGRILRQLTDLAGILPVDIYYTTFVKYRPASNLETSIREQMNFHPYLDMEIGIVKPKLIITLGSILFYTLHPSGLGSMRRRIEHCDDLRGGLAPFRTQDGEDHRCYLTPMNDLFRGMRISGARKGIEADWSKIWANIKLTGILCPGCEGEYSREGTDCHKCKERMEESGVQ